MFPEMYPASEVDPLLEKLRTFLNRLNFFRNGNENGHSKEERKRRNQICNDALDELVESLRRFD